MTDILKPWYAVAMPREDTRTPWLDPTRVHNLTLGKLTTHSPLILEGLF